MPQGTCSIDGCPRPVFARSLCGLHYQRWYKEQVDPCEIAGCGKPGVARGWCQMHYCRWRKHGDPLVTKSKHDSHVDPGCDVDGCDQPHYGRGRCKPHYRELPDRLADEQRYRGQADVRLARRLQNRERNRKRRAYINAWQRLRGSDRFISSITRQQVFDRDGWRCQLCGRKTRGKWPAGLSPTIDHIIPLARGGDHSPENLQCACWRCNLAKGAGAANDQLRLAT